MEGQMQVNFADVFVLLALLVGAVVGFRRGLSDQLARPLSMLLGLLATLYTYGPMESLVEMSQGLSAEMKGAAAIALTAVAAIICMVLARMLLTRLIRLFVAQESERVGGVVLGAVRAALAVLILFLLMNIMPYPSLNRIFGEDSLIGRQVVKITPMVSREIEKLRLAHGHRQEEEAAPAEHKSAAQSIRQGKKDRVENWTHIQDR